MDKDSSGSDEKPSTTLPGTVEKIIKSPDPTAPEKAQITVEVAEELYREVRIDNILKDKNGEAVALKKGSKVDVTIEADPKDIIKKNEYLYLCVVMEKTACPHCGSNNVEQHWSAFSAITSKKSA